jgi:hypothetical protein
MNVRRGSDKGITQSVSHWNSMAEISSAGTGGLLG